MAETKQPSQREPSDLLHVLKGWWRQDNQHSNAWRTQAREDFAFVAGHGQWTALERAYLESEEGGRRAPITFNRTLTLIEAVSGIEINGRHETVFLPRGTKPGVVQKNELLTGASKWMDDESDAPSAQSRAFQDCVKCGMGWTEAALDYETEADGSYKERRIDPLEMWWDHKAREANLSDARRIWHVRSDIDIEDARAMFPDVTDEDLDATWCDPKSTDEARTAEQKRKRDDENAEGYDARTVTIVRVQWIEKEPYIRATVTDDVGQQHNADLAPAEFKQLNALATQRGLPPVRGVKMMRQVYKQAFIGSRILSETYDAPCPHFTLNCVTGKVDETKGTWYGITALVRDPQKWANKWLTQSLHILNTTARGGILAERDAFADQRDAEANYARPDAITWVTPRAISDGKIMAKPGGALPTGHLELMQFAIAAIRDASGINLEILGLREATQPGVLEAQRKQAGMTILATLFDSLRAFRKRVGRVRLYYLQEYLSDGRMIRLAMPGGEQYVPLLRDRVAGRYDVIVGDAPTSPNMKEQTWAQLQPLLAMYKDAIPPELLKDAIPPELLLELIEYSPLPSAVVERMKKAIAEAQQKAAADPEAQQQKQIAMRGAIAKVAETEAKTDKIRAETASIPIDDAVKVADAERARTHPPKPPERGKVSAVQ